LPPDAAGEAIILLPPRAAAGVTTAWSSAAAADSSQKRIAMAGDSIVADSLRRITLRAEALARLDSLRRAAIYGGDSGVRVDTDSTQPASAPQPDSAVPARRPRRDSVSTRARTDSAGARNGARPAAQAPVKPPAAVRPKPIENPFRLPPAGAGA
jgi:hypothetical protein